LLAHLSQGSAVPDGDGNSAEGRRSGEQEAGAPEIPARAEGCVLPTSTGPALKNLRNMDLRKGKGYRNLILRTASMALKSDYGPKRYRNRDLKS
jgi:hypothetical protein